jgi:cation:H+ antiporter
MDAFNDHNYSLGLGWPKPVRLSPVILSLSRKGSLEEKCMSPGIAVLVFILCLIATLISSEVLVRGLTVLGTKRNWTDGFLGLLTALGADAPEITTAIAAIFAGAADLGRGVVLGSNLFNLAMLLGLSAVLAGRVCIRRQGLTLDGTVALLTLLVVTALLLGLLAPALATVLLVVLFIPYVVLVGLRPRHVDRLPLPDGLAHRLSRAASQIHEEQEAHQQMKGSWLLVLLAPCALLVIVIASVWLVQATLTLAEVWHLPQALVGGVILAALTSIPNAYTAVHLAHRGRGAAVVSATVNSNTLNLVVGLALPAVVFGLRGAASGVFLELGWLLGMTVIGLLLLIPAKGMTRMGGAAMIVLYLLFVVIHLLWPTI